MRSEQGLNIYEAQPGDTLDKIITEFYGAVSVPKLLKIQKHIIAQNTDMKKPSDIKAGHILVFDSSYEGTLSCGLTIQSSNKIKNELKGLSKRDKKVFFPLVENNIDWFQVSGLGVTFSTSTGVKINQFVKSNEKFIRELIHNYESYVKGKITKHSYEKVRQSLLTDFSLFSKKTFHINTSTAKKYRAIVNVPGSRFTGFDSHITNMARTSRLLSRAPLVGQLYDVGTTTISAVGAYQLGGGKAAGYEIVGGVGSILGGSIGGYVGTLVVMSGPAGWAVAVAVGVGAAGLSYFGQKIFQGGYKAILY